MGKREIEVDAKSSANRMWAGIKDSATLFPKLFPDHIKSIEVVQGDGTRVGSVRLLKYAQGVPIVTFAKEKLEVAHEKNKLVCYSVIDGEVATLYKSFKATLRVIPKANDEGSLVKWSVDYEKASEEGPDPNLLLEYAAKTISALDDYLLKA